MFNAGLQIDEGGAPKPTRDYGSLLRLNSSQMNSLSRGVKPGSFSSFGQPLNSMYANNPGFFKSGGDDFAAKIAQRNQSGLTPGAPAMSREQKIAQAQQSGTFGSIRDKYNTDAKSFGKQMDESGSITSLTPYRPGLEGPTAQSQTENRSALQDRSSGLKLLREMSQTPLQTSVQDGGVNISGKYGSGWSAPVTAGKKNEGLIGGRPASEVMQGLATSQVREGTWREGDALPYEDQNDGLDPNKVRRGIKDVTEENRQKILSRQRLAAKNR